MASSSSSPNHSDFHVFFKFLVSETPEGQFLRIQLSVLATTVLLFLLLILGSIRRFVRFGSFLKYLPKIIYTLIPISITYIMGLMHNASAFHVLYPFWACVLLYAYGGVVTMTAFDLTDNDDTLRYFWRTLPLFFWTVWLVVLYSDHTHIIGGASYLGFYAVHLFVFSAILNAKETLQAFYMASKSKGLPFVVKPTVRYMREGRDVPINDGAVANPLSMSRYRYLVWGNPMDANGFITTEEIWQSVDEHFRIDCVGRESWKDLCLSYAFFRLILRRFADFPLYESSEPRTRHFIREGLLAMDLERVFHIIDVELEFLFEFFYTKSHVCTSSLSISQVLQRLINFVVFGLFAFYGLPLLISQKQQAKLSSIQVDGHSLEVGVTRLVTLIFCLLELWTVFNVSFSNKMMVWLLYKACRRRRMAATNDGGSIVTRINWIWNVKDRVSKMYLFRFLFKPWQRRLGQYSFLESYTKVPKLAHFSWFGIFVRMPRAGQAGESSVELSTEVKQAIVTSLLVLLREAPNDQPIRLTQGRATIARYPLSEEVSHGCQLETDAHVILVWHIATSLCTAQYRHLENNDANFLVATQLSKYCAYLVTFAPELLPGHSFDTERLFDVAVEQAKHDKPIGLNMSEGNTVTNVGINIVSNNVQNLDIVVDEDSDEVVKEGYVLADRLMNEAIFSTNDSEQGWRFLAEFWAELLLYLAPSDNVAIHGEYLAKGGEFITHLWALLTHAGVVTRSINCPPIGN